MLLKDYETTEQIIIQFDFYFRPGKLVWLNVKTSLSSLLSLEVFFPETLVNVIKIWERGIFLKRLSMRLAVPFQ